MRCGRGLPSYRDPAPVSQDDDSCDKLFKLKHCREKLHDQYYGLVYRVWQWNNLEEGLSSVMELISHSESGNGEHLKDSSKKRRESLEEMMANWERSFDEKINDEEFSALFAKCKEVLTNLKETLNNDDVSLTPIQNKIEELIVLANIQRQYLSKQCGNVETHKVCSALQNLYKIFSSKTQEQGLTESDSKPAEKQNEKKKKGKDTASSIHSDLKQIVDFVCQKQSFVQKLEKIFPPEGTENIRVPNDVIQWAKACVEAHGALIELSDIKELEKTTELYKTVKELFDNECAKVEAQQKIEKIMEGFTANFADFFAKVMLLIGEIDEHLQVKKKPQDSSKKLKKTLEDAKDRLIQECHKKVNYLREERINLVSFVYYSSLQCNSIKARCCLFDSLPKAEGIYELVMSCVWVCVFVYVMLLLVNTISQEG
ncbi:hypothetical protein HOLleu_23835 [Holothuria leucospilota]|uniref:Uncharacterized protein n=1 Tax=Holothuria leucospilota TaxID=206669 RepID=A0A9Q1H357_HOLLE|nr:hypothetical protein HOLleu_23835 [Holothuria leucospilota]